MPLVTVETPAKVNLCLAVGPARPDGYHPLATVYQAIGLYDRVTAVPAADGEVSLELDPASPVGEEALAAVPTDGRNLAVRAARLLAEHTEVTAGAHLRLRKAIPVAGGLAGGSSDAAAALVACNRLWGTGLGQRDLAGLGARLGSDVPFCLVGGTAVGHGRGELVTPVLARGRYHWVLAVAEQGLSTSMVYAELDRHRSQCEREGVTGIATELQVPDALLQGLSHGDVSALGRAMFNDLQPAAASLRPNLSEVVELAVHVGAYRAMVSGSGPTVLFLAHDADHAHRMCRPLTAAGVHAAYPAVGPVPGARVVAA